MNDIQLDQQAQAEAFRVDGRVALVTGAGRGIGRGAALALAEAGAEVVLMSRTAAELDEVAGEISQARRPRVDGVLRRDRCIGGAPGGRAACRASTSS